MHHFNHRTSFRILLKLIVILLHSQWLLAQESRLSIAAAPELKQKQIRCLLKDSKNRLWCGTDDGIYCYDGYQVITFRNDKNHKTISDNLILCACSAPGSSNLIFGTDKGITWINTEKMQALYTNTVTGRAFPLEYCQHLVYVGNNEYWGVAYSIPFSLNFSGKNNKFSVKKLELKGVTPDASIQFFPFYRRPNGMPEIYLTNRDGDVAKVNRLDYTVKITGEQERGLTYMGTFGKSILYSSFKGLRLQDTITGKEILLSPGGITSTFQDQSGHLWFVVDRTKIYKYDGGPKLRHVMTLNSAEEENYQHVFSILTDRNNVWIGTSKGLLNMKPQRPCFEEVWGESERFSRGELSSRGMLQVNDSCVLLCGYHYFVSYDPRNGNTRELLQKKDAESLAPYALSRTGDSVWIATEGAGLKLFLLSRRKLMNPDFVNPKKLEFVKKGLLRTATISGSWIYLAEYGFLSRINYKTGEVQVGGKLKLNDTSEYQNVCRVETIGERELLIANNNLVVITDTALNIKTIVHSYDLPGVTNGLITCAAADSTGIWIGTQVKGLYFFDRLSRKIKRWTMEDGLADNTIYSMIPHKKKIFIGTRNGLSVFDRRTSGFNNYFSEDGLLNNEFNGNSFLSLSNGDVLMGGINGVTRIKPELLEEKLEMPDFFFSKLVLAGKGSAMDSVIAGGLDEMNEVVLPYQHRFLQVFFALTNYSSFNRFAYMLEGAGEQWIDLGPQNQIIFNSLEPGEYKLHIRAWDERGNLLKNELTLRITAMQVFYKTTDFLVLFIILLVLIVSSIFYVYHRIKIRNIQRMADLRLKIASELHDQVGGLLNKTAIQAELVNSKAEIRDQKLDNIATNSRTALNSMRDILWNLDPRNDNTGSLIERMKEYVSKMLEDDFKYEIKIEGVEELELTHEVRQNLNMIFKEAVNNIVKHAQGSKVKIFFGMMNQELVLYVHSSIPLKGELISSGQGIRNMRMRAEAIKAQFNLDTENGVGINVALMLNHI